MELNPTWEFVADRVMGGVSCGQVTQSDEGARLTGQVSLENNGGFVQMAFDLAAGAPFDASAWEGIEIELRGNGEVYDIRLRTDQLRRPWESYRASLLAPLAWQVAQVPFSEFIPHRTKLPFNSARLRRIGILAIGRAFEADITVRALRLY